MINAATLPHRRPAGDALADSRRLPRRGLPLQPRMAKAVPVREDASGEPDLVQQIRAAQDTSDATLRRVLDGLRNLPASTDLMPVITQWPDKDPDS